MIELEGAFRIYLSRSWQAVYALVISICNVGPSVTKRIEEILLLKHSMNVQGNVWQDCDVRQDCNLTSSFYLLASVFHSSWRSQAVGVLLWEAIAANSGLVGVLNQIQMLPPALDAALRARTLIGAGLTQLVACDFPRCIFCPFSILTQKMKSRRTHRIKDYQSSMLL